MEMPITGRKIYRSKNSASPPGRFPGVAALPAQAPAGTRSRPASLPYFLIAFAVLLLTTAIFTAILPAAAAAAENPVTIMVDGEPLHTFAWEELQTMQSDPEAWVGPRLYSTINTWPTKRWYLAEGVKLTALFERAEIFQKAGIGFEDIQEIKIKSTDGFLTAFTKKELFDDPRYFFPGLKENHEYFGEIAGNPSEPEPEPAPAIIALNCAEDSDNPLHMNPGSCPLLVLGQHYITEQTNHVFVKYTCEIDLCTTAPQRWAAPLAEPLPLPGGTVPLGTKVRLSNEFNDADKIYYTTDGTDPTRESPIYNWIAGRWRNSRESDFEEVNKPIEINEDTTIKAVTIGFGREDSEISSFEYKVERPEEPPETPAEPPELSADTTNNTVNSAIEITFEDETDWREAITGVEIDEETLPEDKYTIGEGSLTFDAGAGIFTAVKNYSIVVKAAGYRDAAATQPIKTSSGSGSGSGSEPGTTPDPIVLIISGDGVATPKEYTQAQLEALPQHEERYTSINTWPTKSWYVGKGITLDYLLGSEQAGLRGGAALINFYAADGYRRTLTVQELLNEPRYRFPNFMEGGSDSDGHLPGSPAGAERVETILGLLKTAGTDPSYMNEVETPLLMLGQRAVTEQSGPSFVKNVHKIEVLTDYVPQWEEPTASIPSGEVPPGTKLELYSEFNDDDKVHYTLDGSTPTLESPMFNWVAKRWWAQRGDELVRQINKPIVLTEDTTVKAVTIGPGKRDSGVVTFTYKVKAAGGSAAGAIAPEKDGEFSPGDQVILKIPAGVLLGDIVGHWAREAIEELAAQGAIGGYPDGSFKPDHEITRAEFATILVKAFGLENKSGKIFADTKEHWARDYLATAVSNGIVSGYDPLTFGPDDLLTREQMAVMLFGAAKLPPAEGQLGFSDSGDISAWAQKPLSVLINHGFIQGYPDNTLRPQGRATRAEAVTVILKALEKCNENE